jgi:putative ABC transport system ATP-binding protein
MLFRNVRQRGRRMRGSPPIETRLSVVEGAVGAETPIIHIKNLTRVREQNGVVFELTVPAFSLISGSFVALLGENGSGKSTLLDVLALILPPTNCEAFTLAMGVSQEHRIVDVKRLWEDGNEAELAAIRRNFLGYVLQTGGLFPFLSVRQNIELPLRMLGLPYAGAVEALAKHLKISDFLEKKPQFLSGGQRQRSAVGRALIHHPRVILADEPTAAVDRIGARAIIADLVRLSKQEGATVLMVTHDPDLIQGATDQEYHFSIENSDGITRSTCEPAR